MVQIPVIARQTPVSFKQKPVAFAAGKKKELPKPAEVKDAPVLEHNLDPNSFKWLFVKYVRGINDKHHCTNGFIGQYSDKIGAADRLRRAGKKWLDPQIKFDEQPLGSYDAIYICGVSKKGYNSKEKLPYWEKENYKNNLHVAIKSVPGQSDQQVFNDKWNLKIKNGIFLPIPGEAELPERYKKLGDEFLKCRMFRWIACFYDKLKKDGDLKAP